MIDWITAIIPCADLGDSQLNDGYISRVKPDGELEWQKEIPKDIPGSHDSNIRVSRDPVLSCSHLRIDGNPAKWFQGHNIFGSGNLVGLVNHLMKRLAEIIPLYPTLNERNLWANGFYKLNRVDCTEMWELPSRGDVFSWLNMAQYQAKSRHGKPIMTGGTLYFGKHSRRWTFKFYSKGEEINARKHKLPTSLPFYDDLQAFADNKLRGELSLRKPELQKHFFDYAVNWTLDTPRELFDKFLSRMDFSNQFKLASNSLKDLSPRLTLAYNSWLEGHDLRNILPKNTFYRYRRELLKHGIDISVSKQNEIAKPIALKDIIAKEPVPLPSWALGSGVYFCPDETCPVAEPVEL